MKFRNFPDSKGIKTVISVQCSLIMGLETSLTPKGLRQTNFNVSKMSLPFRNFPDSKGIKTKVFERLTLRTQFRNFPDSKGIKTQRWHHA